MMPYVKQRLDTIARIERLMEAEADPHKRNQYRQVIKQTLDKLEG